MIALVVVAAVYLLVLALALVWMGITHGPFDRRRSCARFGWCESNCPAGACLRDLSESEACRG